MKKSIAVLIVIIIVVLIGGGAAYYYTAKNQPKPVACTMEAKICPDGSSVGRTGPNCEFAPCPDITAGWNILENSESGFSLKYPDNFFDQGHEPKILVGNCNYDVFPGKCPNIVDEVVKGSPSGSSVDAVISNWGNRDGKKMTVNSAPYCYYSIGDAAMMHQYYYDYYATVKDQKCIVVQLDSVSVSCDVYLPLESGNTEQAKNYNDCLSKNAERPKILNEIINTFKFTK